MSDGRIRAWTLIQAAGIYILLTVLFTPEAATGQGFFWYHDLRHHHLPWRAWAAAEWLAGRVPWWAPGAANGFPLLAEGQGGFLYPPGMLPFLLFPAPAALTVNILGHQAWAGLGMHLYAHRRGMRGMAPYVAGIVWMFSGFMVSHTLYLGMQNALAWGGWLLWATLDRRWPVVSLCVGMIGLAGHPQAAAFLGLIGAVHAAGALRRPGEIARWGLAAAGGAALASPQLVATLELSRSSMRDGGVDAGFAGIGAMPIQEWIGAVLPSFFGFDRPGDVTETYYHRGPGYWGQGVNHWEMCFFLGFPVVILAIIGARRSRGWAAGGLICLLLMAGGPLWDLVRLLPGFGWFRFPARFAMGVSMAAAILAAGGWERAARLQLSARIGIGVSAGIIPEPRELRQIRAAVIAGLALALAGAGLGTVALEAAEPRMRAALTARFERKVAQQAEQAGTHQVEAAPPASPMLAAALPPPEPEVAALIPYKVDRIVAGLRRDVSLAAPEVWWPALTLLLLAWGLRRPGWLPLLILADLWWFGHGYQRLAPPGEVLQRPEWLSSNLTEPGGWRLTVLDRRGPEELDGQLLSASLGLVWGTQDVILPSPLLMVRNDAFLAATGLDIGDKGSVKVQRYLRRQAWARRMGVRWLLSRHEIPGLQELMRTGEPGPGTDPVRLYADTGALPRARMVPCWRQVAGPEAVWAGLDGADPARTVLIEDGTERAEQCAAGTGAGIGAGITDGAAWPGEARIVDYQPQSVEIAATGPGVLVLADSWYPGWRATVEPGGAAGGAGGAAQEVPILRADLLFRAVVVSAGAHTIRFRFDPGRAGRLLPAAGLGMIGMLGWALATGGRRAGT